MINPPGYTKSALWSDDGQNLRVVLLPASKKALGTTDEFKFYVVGGVTGLQIVPGSIQAFKKSGEPVFGVTGFISP